MPIVRVPAQGGRRCRLREAPASSGAREGGVGPISPHPALIQLPYSKPGLGYRIRGEAGVCVGRHEPLYSNPDLSYNCFPPYPVVEVRVSVSRAAYTRK